MVDISKEPDFVNEKGAKWWFDSSLTDYARKKNLRNYRVWYVKDQDGGESFVVVIQKKDKAEPVYYNSGIEFICSYIDFVSLVAERKREEFNKKNPYRKKSISGANRAFRGG